MTPNEAKELFEYRDGELYWKVDAAYNVKSGSIAGNLEKTGYKRITYKGRSYLAHRIIFLIHHGFLPPIVDHIDNNPLNNKIQNLRNADKSKNGMNRRANFNCATGIKNVTKAGKKFRVAITVKQKYINIGTFENLELAELVAIEVRNKYQGEYANHG